MSARYAQIARHDAEHLDVFVIPDTIGIVRRFNVLMPSDATIAQVCDTAQTLVAYTRLVLRPEPEVYIDRQKLRTDLSRLRFHEQQQERRLRGRYAAPLPMEPTAEERARELLAQVDPTLSMRMNANRAFYFSTDKNTYIWYPSERAIVSLEPAGPHYVCIHSRDHSVEQNRYDWALTMRTYLLGDETHWRDKANFHTEFSLRGGRGAHPDIVR